MPYGGPQQPVGTDTGHSNPTPTFSVKLYIIK